MPLMISFRRMLDKIHRKRKRRKKKAKQLLKKLKEPKNQSAAEADLQNLEERREKAVEVEIGAVDEVRAEGKAVMGAGVEVEVEKGARAPKRNLSLRKI